MPEISIIVPVYNVEKWLSRCIESILAQTFRDFELILVDDGSTDKSLEICEEYRQKDLRIKIIKKENGGLSEARNIGIDKSKGKYIGFVDSDDWIDSEMYEILYNLCEKRNADISTCSIQVNDMKNIEGNTGEIIEFTSKEAIRAMYNNVLSGYSACNKLYKRDVFNEKIFPKGRMYEDASIMYRLYDCANKVIFQNTNLYKYINRQDSITTSKFSEKRLDIIIMFDEVKEYMKNNNYEMYYKIDYMYYNSLRQILVDIVNEKSISKNYKYIKLVSKAVRASRKDIIENELITKNHKILANIIAYTPIIAISYYKYRGEA